jgi:hypothetical protein
MPFSNEKPTKLWTNRNISLSLSLSLSLAFSLKHHFLTCVLRARESRALICGKCGMREEEIALFTACRFALSDVNDDKSRVRSRQSSDVSSIESATASDDVVSAREIKRLLDLISRGSYRGGNCAAIRIPGAGPCQNLAKGKPPGRENKQLLIGNPCARATAAARAGRSRTLGAERSN